MQERIAQKKAPTLNYPIAFSGSTSFLLYIIASQHFSGEGLLLFWIWIFVAEGLEESRKNSPKATPSSSFVGFGRVVIPEDRRYICMKWHLWLCFQPAARGPLEFIENSPSHIAIAKAPMSLKLFVLEKPSR